MTTRGTAPRGWACRARAPWRPPVAAAAGLALTLSAASHVAGAQSQTVARPVEPAASGAITVAQDMAPRQAVQRARATLRRLVAAQEVYWRGRRTYASEAALLPMFHPDAGVVVEITHAEPGGWAARAELGTATVTHSCVVWVGAIEPPERPATAAEQKVYPEAEVSCDGDGYTAPAEWDAAGRSYMTYALRALRRSETRYRAVHRRYTADLGALDPFVWDPDVSVTVTAATADGWRARATFRRAPGMQCLLAHGAVPAGDPAAPDPRPVPDDVVTCD